MENSWKHLMKEILLETKIVQQKELNGRNLDPKLVMDIRHQLVRNGNRKHLPMSKEVVVTEARSLIRQENSKKLAKEKEEKILTRELEQLKQKLDNDRLLCQKTVDENSQKKRNTIWRKVESYSSFWEIDSWVAGNCNAKCTDELYPDFRITVTKKESVINDEKEESNKMTEEESKKGKNEIMQRFFQSTSRIERSRKMHENPLEMVNGNEEAKENVREVSNDLGLSDEDGDESLGENVAENSRKLRRCWKIWRKFILRRKMEKDKVDREKKIATFLERLAECRRERKKTEIETDFPKATNPVAFGRRQKRREEAKEEEKLERLEKEVEESSKEAYLALAKNMHRFDSSFGGRIKMLKIMSNLGKNKSDRMEGRLEKVFPIPELLLRMEKRDRERKERWEAIEERKRRIHQEKEKVEREKEHETKQSEEKEKREKLRQLKEKRRLEKEAQQQRKKEREKLRRQTALAVEHRRRFLLEKCGFDPWKRLIRSRKAQEERALRFRLGKSMAFHFSVWRDFVRQITETKSAKARFLYEKKLVANCFRMWISECDEMIKKYQVAVDWSDMKITEKTWNRWIRFVQIQRFLHVEKESTAIDLHRRRVKEKYFKAWKNFPEFLKMEREKEERKRIWREKVARVLPDYRPPYWSCQISSLE